MFPLNVLWVVTNMKDYILPSDKEIETIRAQKKNEANERMKQWSIDFMASDKEVQLSIMRMLLRYNADSLYLLDSVIQRRSL